ncbi:signal peptidase II [Pararhodobacter marinus]|uniref:Lipoprotein signal peptidase n=1 Tax=Pararhodobacter marinus TaxID=2184063 RepID=A0A2U2CIF1_9RHOB|nr:signal peptidase II [Pararhodobacter marinus]PWE31642.1 signal peptidase II [Pararhodobacter marinus]
MRTAFWTSFLVLAVDQALKWLIVVGLNLREELLINIWPPYLTLTMAWNRGVNFGLFAADSVWLRAFLVILPVVVSVWVWRWVRKEGAHAGLQVAAGFLIGGALGNAIDRVVWGAVADFLNVTCCGIRNPWAFNVADIAIFVGAFGLILVSGAKTTRDEG